MERCYIFEDEEWGYVGVMASSEDGARWILAHNTNANGKANLADVVDENDPLFDEILDSYGCDVL